MKIKFVLLENGFLLAHFRTALAATVNAAHVYSVPGEYPVNWRKVGQNVIS